MLNRMIQMGVMLLIVLSGCRSPRPLQQPVVRHAAAQLESSLPSDVVAVAVSESASVEEYVQVGLALNPRIQEAMHKIQAAQHRLPQVMSLPDPVVATSTHLAPVQTAAGEQAFSLGVSQKFTNAERRATLASIVSEEVAAAEAVLKQTQLEVAEGIRTACYQLLFVRESIAITEQDQATLEQIAEVVLRQYEVKRLVTQQDVLNVQTEQSKIENQLTELRQKEKSFQSRLARLLHCSPNSSFQIVDELASKNALLNAGDLIEQATRSRPDLRRQLADIRRDRKKVHLAKLEAKPDLTLGFNWIATSSDGISPVANGDDALLLGIGFNLPVYKSRIRAGICEARANQRASESRLESLQDQAREEVFDLVARLDSTRETLHLLQSDMIPKAERNLELSIDEYATDSIQYVQLIANWRSLLRYRITEANLQSTFHQQLASLARSVGQLEPIQEALPQETPPAFDSED